MRKILLVGALLAVVSLGPAPIANATAPIGPICLTTAPFADQLVWFLDAHGATATKRYFDSVGRDVAGNRSQSVSAFVDGNTLVVGYTTYPQAGFVPVTAGGRINLGTGNGPGQCFAPDLASCGNFTFQIIACPPGALSGDAPEAELTGRAQGQ